MIKRVKAQSIIALLVIAGGTVIITRPDSVQITRPGASPHINVLNTELLDQNGTSVRFASDIAGDRIMAINFIYTNCTTACPVVSAIFEKLQSQLGKKLQQDVRMVSLSINPTADTPEKLKTHAEHFHTGPEWVWLTGEKTRVNTLLKGLGVYNTDYTNHIPVILIGDPIRKVWTRFNGLTSPEVLAAKIDEMLAARNEAS